MRKSDANIFMEHETTTEDRYNRGTPMTANTMCLLDARLSKAQVMAMAHSLHHDEDGIAEMLAMMRQTDNPRMAYNAAWVLTHLPAEDKRLYLFHRYKELVHLATSEALCFRRGLVLSILVDLPTEDEPDTELLDYCLVHITDMNENDSNRVCMIKLAARMCQPYPELCNELLLTLEILPPDISKSMACAKKNAQKIIEQAMNKQNRLRRYFQEEGNSEQR